MKEALYLVLGFCGAVAIVAGMYVLIAKILVEPLTGVEWICLGFAFLLSAQVPFGNKKGTPT